MSRKDSYYHMLQSASKFQYNISLILEAKAVEAARSCQWLCGHLSEEHFRDHGEQVKTTIEVHEQILEVIDSMTKMEQALARHMQLLLAGQEDGGGQGLGGGGDGDFFSYGGDDSK
ncbi:MULTISPECIES: hypothetical protein [Paenibacillus]|uniref:hypothetical protein n=1 Tax=Paenibacillus TaxID=44249 RepID=UPI0022B90470|nr:hypothetical protein [Paenibacillus caseinilyticus]MCZ8519160.1 hypothetical protein [Paenibacillus caseinilyticus]